MITYAFWNNKGGVGKTFLCFIASCEYAHRHPETDVYVIDLCPQANASEILLGGAEASSEPMRRLMDKVPRGTIAGYLEARLNSPFVNIPDVSPYVAIPSQHNKTIPHNLKLVCGDNLLELQAEAIRQTSQLSVPVTAWKTVLGWVKDLCSALGAMSGDRDSVFFLDCNPSFAIYTQLAIVAADRLAIPFTADDSSRRGIENVVALAYGIASGQSATYAKISFAQRAKDEGIAIPKLHSFVSNRQTIYEGRPSRAFEAVSKTIRDTMDAIHSKHRSIFSEPKNLPSTAFIEVPDYHSACIVSASTGTPLHQLKPGPKTLHGERFQINPEPLKRYSQALEKFVDCL